MQVIFVPMEPAVLHGLSHGPKLKTIKRRREFTPRRNKLVHEVACWPRPRPWPAISRVQERGVLHSLEDVALGQPAGATQPRASVPDRK
jgi:hypothetical protein